MPPHGRRRLSGLTIVLSLFLLFVSTASAASAVLGIDLGTEYIKAALVKPGVPLEIVLTKDSKRKETAAVAFKPLRNRVNTAESDSYPERLYGGDAVALSARYPGDVYTNLKPLLGLKLTDELTTEYGRVHSGLRLVERSEMGTIGFKSEAFVPEEEAWSVEELLAMELKNIKDNAEAMAGKYSTVSDAVITIPPFYTVEEKRAVTLAADLAGLRVLSLISDGLAVGLNYATSRTFPTINDGGKPEIHLVYDMGAGSTTATVLKFQGRIVKDVGKFNKTVQEVQVLGTGWDKSLGGDVLNKLVLEDMIEAMTSTSQLKALEVDSHDIKSHGRTMAKLWKECERMRQVLSANTETSTIMEGLYNEDFNFKYKLSRTGFEKLASPYLSRVKTPIEEALESAKLSFDDLESVILYGGAVRTPFVQKQLEAIIQGSDKIRTNVNADEAAVFGAAFRAAAINPSFRVKEIRAVDSASYPVTVSWSVNGKDKQQKLFIPTSLVGAEKELALKATADLSFSMSQQIVGNEIPLSVARTQNLTSSVKSLVDKGCTTNNITTKFSFRLSPVDGSPEMVRGTISCEIAEAEVKKGGVMEGLKDVFGLGSKKGDQEHLKEEEDTESSMTTSEVVSSTMASSADAETSKKPAKSSAKDGKSKDMKKRTQSMYIGFTTEIEGKLGAKSLGLEPMKMRLAAFDKSDRSRVYREETLNRLEGYTYKIRDILEDEGFITASTTKQRDDIEAKSNDASVWLYGDGVEANREDLQARLDILRNLVEPIQKRKDEAKKRPDEIQKLQDALQQADTLVNVIKVQVQVESVSAEPVEESKSEAFESETTTAPSSSTDDFADLEEETSTSSASTISETPPPPRPAVSEAEIAAVVEQREATQKWLDEKLAEQEKLSPTDEPVLLSEDLSIKSRDINNAVMDLLQKQMKESPTSSKKSKATKAKRTTSATPSTTSSVAEGSTAGFGEQSKETTGPPMDFEDELGGMEGMREVSSEEIEGAMEEQKSKAERTKKSAKPKATGKGKSKSKGKSKGKDKGREKERQEREL
ncbi:lumenal Hsp70 protein [Puttea exsequens]|nr:lumenal Hsp70 protein [Puttea exsequens]